MQDVIYDHLGIPHKTSHIKMVDRLLKLKRQNSTNIWPVLRAVVETWIETHPTQWKSYLVELGDIKNTRLDSKFGLSRDKSQHIRYTVDMPEQIYFMIRALYSEEELPMGGQDGRDFFRLFIQHFPQFAVAAKQ